MATRDPIFITGFETVLSSEAARAAIEAAAETNPSVQAGKVLSTILLSVAAIEATVGIWTAFYGSGYGVDDRTLREWRGTSAPLVMKDILSRLKPPVAVKDVSWYTGYCAIVVLRNHVAHYFPELRAPGTWPDELKGYITGRLLIPGGDDSMDWTSRLLIPSVANQVIAHGRAVIQGFVEVAWKAA
jgi:hypothetical protein